MLELFEFEIPDAPENPTLVVGPIENGRRKLTITGWHVTSARLTAVYTAPSTFSTSHDLMIDVLDRLDRKLTVWDITDVKLVTVGQTSTWETNLDPTPTPSANAIETKLNETWGRAANIFFTVVKKSGRANYDLVPFDGMLAVTEESQVVLSAEIPGERYEDLGALADFNLYFVNQMRNPPQEPDKEIAGYTKAEDNRCFVRLEDHQGSRDGPDLTLYVVAHEVGHVLGQENHSPQFDIKAQMWEGIEHKGCEVRHADWTLANP